MCPDTTTGSVIAALTIRQLALTRFSKITRPLRRQDKTRPRTERSSRGKPTYRFHGSCHIVVPLRLLGQPGFLHQLLAVYHLRCGCVRCLVVCVAGLKVASSSSLRRAEQRRSSTGILSLQLLPAVCVPADGTPLPPPTTFPSVVSPPKRAWPRRVTSRAWQHGEMTARAPYCPLAMEAL